MSRAERVAAVRNRWARSLLILAGGTAISAGLVSGCNSEQDKSQELRAEISDIREELGQYAGIYFQGEPEPDDPRLARIEELSQQAEPHENRVGWLAPAAAVSVIATMAGTAVSLASKPES